MKEKIRNLLKFLLNSWTKFTEIGTVIWAVNGIMGKYESINWGLYATDTEYHITPIIAYFLSAVLILYLLRKYERKN